MLSADSPWNTAIPDAPTVYASSAAIVTKLTSWNSGQPMPFAAGTYGTANDFDIPVYHAAVSDPLVTINTTGKQCAFVANSGYADQVARRCCAGGRV